MEGLFTKYIFSKQSFNGKLIIVVLQEQGQYSIFHFQYTLLGVHMIIEKQKH